MNYEDLIKLIEMLEQLEEYLENLSTEKEKALGADTADI